MREQSFYPGNQVIITDPCTMTRCGTKYIPGMHGKTGKIIGKYTDIINAGSFNQASRDKYVVEIEGVSIESSCVDVYGKRQPTWYILPHMTKVDSKTFRVLRLME